MSEISQAKAGGKSPTKPNPATAVQTPPLPTKTTRDSGGKGINLTTTVKKK